MIKCENAHKPVCKSTTPWLASIPILCFNVLPHLYSSFPPLLLVGLPSSFLHSIIPPFQHLALLLFTPYSTLHLFKLTSYLLSLMSLQKALEPATLHLSPMFTKFVYWSMRCTSRPLWWGLIVVMCWWLAGFVVWWLTNFFVCLVVSKK